MTCFCCGKDWRPRRTIVFCGWGSSQQDASPLSAAAEAAASFQWAENKANILFTRAVAYLNLDTVVNGKYAYDDDFLIG